MELKAIQLEVIRLRLDNWPHKKIAEKLNITVQKLRNWSGLKIFQEEEERQRQLIIEIARNKLNANIDLAINTLINATDKKLEYNTVQVKASELILKYAGMEKPAKQEIKIDAEVTNLSLEEKKIALLNKFKQNEENEEI